MKAFFFFFLFQQFPVSGVRQTFSFWIKKKKKESLYIYISWYLNSVKRKNPFTEIIPGSDAVKLYSNILCLITMYIWCLNSFFLCDDETTQVSLTSFFVILFSFFSQNVFFFLKKSVETSFSCILSGSFNMHCPGFVFLWLQKWIIKPPIKIFHFYSLDCVVVITACHFCVPVCHTHRAPVSTADSRLKRVILSFWRCIVSHFVKALFFFFFFFNSFDRKNSAVVARGVTCPAGVHKKLK